MTRSIREFDPRGRVAILGAGLAGLSLAQRLIERFDGLEVVVLEARDRLDAERSWCFWSHEPSPLDEHVSRRWDELRVRGPAGDLVVPCGGAPYCHVPSRRFFESAVTRLGRAGRCDLRLGSPVESVTEAPRGVRGHAHGGRGPIDLRADLAFDARPPHRAAARRRGEAVLVQHFTGQEVELDRDALDPARATLMDFDVDQGGGGVHFMYVLPFSRHRALVESTCFLPDGATPPPAEAAIASYCERVFGAAIANVHRVERGALPMTTLPLGPASTRRLWQIGTRGGVARASTGYAASAIQRDAARICDALAAGRPRPAPPRPALLGRLDGILLSLLAARPELGPRLFSTLFARSSTPALLRFLDDRASLRDVLDVGLALPTGLMTRHAVTHRAAWHLRPAGAA